MEMPMPATESESCHGRLFLSTSPPSPAESRGLVEGLVLNGLPLMAPHFVNMGWRHGQRFTDEDDPDRMREPWTAPGFVEEPISETWVEELPIPEELARIGAFARVVHDVLSERECAELISSINQKGFTPALLNIGGGVQKLEPYVRNGHRAMVDSPELTQRLFEALRPHLPAECCGGQLVELNERCRILCYTPGQEFASHFDGNYRRPNGDSSRVTVQLYLHDVPEENGGATTFHFGRTEPSLPCQPRAGSALIFTQDLEHEGSLVRNGIKYTLRTEAMYRRA